MDINQVVIWGYKLNTHTHSFIHNAFYKTFTYLGYKTLWLDNNDNITDIDFTNSLFLTQGACDEKIPIIEKCYYILHNCDMKKYNKIPNKNILIIQVYTHDVIKRNDPKIGDYIHYNQSNTEENYSVLYFPWATDLLPEEINTNIQNLSNIISKNEINFVGMQTEEWDIVETICNFNNIKYNSIGGFKNNVDINMNQDLIKSSLIAPAIQTKWQVDNGYIPCRIFKNISYGKMGITNNKTVYELFNKSIIYHPDILECIKNGIAFEKQNDIPTKNKVLIPLMEFVRDNHTYINRINLILECLYKQQTK